MNIGLRARVAGFDRLFRVQVEQLSDLKEPLRETGVDIQEDSKETFAEERSRTGKTWEPLAGSTRKRLEQTTTSPVTISGQVRKKYIEQVSTWVQRQQKAGKYNTLMGQEFYRLSHGGKPDEAVHDSVRDSFKRLRRELGKTSEQRRKKRKGRRAIDRHGLLGKMYRMIRLSVKNTGATIGILKNSPLSVQNEGGKVGHGATVPGRTFIELLPEDVQRLMERLGKWIVPEKE